MIVALYVLISISVVLILISFLLPNSYTITKTLVINASPALCYMKIADLNFYKEWNPWAKMELNANSIISGKPNTIGHQYTWDGKKIGVGGLTITKLSPYQSIELELEFFKPFKSKSLDVWHFEELENNMVKITWQNSGNFNTVFTRLMGPLVQKNLSKQFEKGLLNIKQLCEATKH